MSDNRVSLDFLGEQMLRMQADLRGVRSEQVKLESEQTSLRADFHRLEGKVDGVDAKVGGLDAKVGGLDAKVSGLDAKVERLEAKVDRYDAANDVRFEQMQQTAATNLALVMKTLESVTGEVRAIKNVVTTPEPKPR